MKANIFHPQTAIFKGVQYPKKNFTSFYTNYMGHAVASLVEALCYKLEGRGFDYR
jgi:hypothetical protein